MLTSQITDCLVIWINVGVYGAPTMLALMCTLCAILSIRQARRQQRIERAVEELSLIITSGRSVPEIVQELANHARGYVHILGVGVVLGVDA